ncbi:hypothetical protein [Streptomyces sp. NPDC002779]|uniref:hypothetical protein n=1 Tax=Streptomyces sp. NPDC002779 TaxID=3364664 RepID=UPI00367DCDFA
MTMLLTPSAWPATPTAVTPSPGGGPIFDELAARWTAAGPMVPGNENWEGERLARCPPWPAP